MFSYSGLDVTHRNSRMRSMMTHPPVFQPDQLGRFMTNTKHLSDLIRKVAIFKQIQKINRDIQ